MWNPNDVTLHVVRFNNHHCDYSLLDITSFFDLQWVKLHLIWRKITNNSKENWPMRYLFQSSVSGKITQKCFKINSHLVSFAVFHPCRGIQWRMWGWTFCALKVVKVLCAVTVNSCDWEQILVKMQHMEPFGNYLLLEFYISRSKITGANIDNFNQFVKKTPNADDRWGDR